jgi:hypothetical protein
MIVTLAAIYHDVNPGAKAREKLCTLEYNIADKVMDIYQVIGTVNNLTDIASITTVECKTMLFEHIPTDLDIYLWRDSKHPTIPYEDFASAVADAAEAKQHTYEKRVEKQQAAYSI